MSGVESLGRVRAKGIALLVIVFVVGVLAGTAFERVRARRAAPEFRPPDAGMMGRLHAGRLPPMFQQLDLTADQRSRIIEIIERGRPRTDAVLGDMLPRLRAVTDSIHSEIRSVLTAEQLAHWDSLIAEFRHRGRGMPLRGGRRGFGRGQAPPPLPWEVQP